MDSIRIDIGVYTALEVDLSGFDFDGVEKVILTIKNTRCTGGTITREFATPEVHPVTVTPMESLGLRDGAEYDFDIVTTDGKCYKNDDNGRVVLRRGCGQCSE